MKKLFINSCLILSVLLSCQDSDDRLSRNNLVIDKSIGEEIDSETAQRWINNFTSRSEESDTRQQASSNSLSGNNLKSIVQSVNNADGIALHYGMDEGGKIHVMALPLEQNPLNTAGLIVDTNTNRFLNKSKANEWGNRYIAKYPNQPRFHFFGIDIIQTITEVPTLNYIDVIPALNEEMSPQLILAVWNNLNDGNGEHKIRHLFTTIKDLIVAIIPHLNRVQHFKNRYYGCN